MAEDFDVEALLEAPYNVSATNGASPQDHKIRSEDDEKKHRKRSRSRERKERKRSKSRSRSRERKHKKSSKRSRSRDRNRERKREKRSRSRSRDRHRKRYDDDRSYDRHSSRRHRNDSHSPRRRTPSYHKEDRIIEEADRRTVFVMQLGARIRPRDLEEFFTQAGKVREVRLIMDNKTRKHKGIAYIEFRDSQSVSQALQLNGQKLCGYPISIQPTQAEKNKSVLIANSSSGGNSAAAPVPTTAAAKKINSEPQRLYVGSLHFNVNEDMLKSIFEPFGTVTRIELMRDQETGRSKGYAFVTFACATDAAKALEQLNGWELAGRAMKVNTTTERGGAASSSSNNNLPSLDSDELDRTGIPVTTATRLELMRKLAEGTGIELPKSIANALNQVTTTGQLSSNGVASSESPESSAVSTQTSCFMLTNMFDPSTENPEENWPEAIREEVLEECRLHGGATHCFVDSASQGNVYVKAASIAAAAKCVSVLHGRWFDGKLVQAAYIPVPSYCQLFPESIAATSLL